MKQFALLVAAVIAGDAAAQRPTVRSPAPGRTSATDRGQASGDAPREMTAEEKRERIDDAKAGAGILGLGVAGFVCVVLGVIAFEMLPWLIAVMRGHNETMPIFLVCFFLGWTGIGWLIALIWAFSSNTRGNDRRRFGRRDYDD